MSPKSRICTRCTQEKDLNSDNYQVVKAFKYGYSFYCNICNVDMRKTKSSNK